MLDFNTAGQQREGNGEAFPPDSIVAFKMTVRPPKAGKEGTQHPLFSRSDRGNEYLDVEFEPANIEGRKIWQNFTLFGSDKAAQISMRTLRAIIESARQIRSDDASPQASAGRQLSDWADFNDMIFLARVKCVVEQSNKDGKYYVNNEITKIITPDMPEYAAGEHISDKPLPPVPDTPGQVPPTSGPGAGFAGPGAGFGAATSKPSTPAGAPGFGGFGAPPAQTAAAQAQPAAQAAPATGGFPTPNFLKPKQ